MGWVGQLTLDTEQHEDTTDNDCPIGAGHGCPQQQALVEATHRLVKQRGKTTICYFFVGISLFDTGEL